MSGSSPSAITPLTIKVKLLQEGAKAPERKSDGASGYDLFALKKNKIGMCQRKLISTGIALEIPKGYEGQVRSRSGLALKHGVVVCQGVGTIDSDYRGEVSVMLLNTDLDNPHYIEAGDRIAQIVFIRVAQPKLEVLTAEQDLQKTVRGDGGFGSTGK